MAYDPFESGDLITEEEVYDPFAEGDIAPERAPTDMQLQAAGVPQAIDEVYRPTPLVAEPAPRVGGWMPAGIPSTLAPPLAPLTSLPYVPQAISKVFPTPSLRERTPEEEARRQRQEATMGRWAWPTVEKGETAEEFFMTGIPGAFPTIEPDLEKYPATWLELWATQNPGLKLVENLTGVKLTGKGTISFMRSMMNMPAELGEFFTSPGGAAITIAGTSPLFRIPITAGFTVDLANNVRKQWKALRGDWDNMTEEQRGRSIADILKTSAFTLMAAKGLRREIKHLRKPELTPVEAAKGELEQILEKAPEARPGEAPPVPTAARPPTEREQRIQELTTFLNEQGQREARGELLSHEQSLINRSYDELLGVKVRASGTQSNGQPLGFRVMSFDFGTGEILVNPREFRKWLKTVPRKQWEKATRTMLWEERIESLIPDGMALDYFNTLTQAERYITSRLYTGSWLGRYPDGTPVSAETIGREALRYRLQRARNMTPTELAEFSITEGWTERSLAAMARTIRAVREHIGAEGTKAARVGLKDAAEALDAMEQTIDKVRDVMQAARLTEAQERELQGIRDKIGELMEVRAVYYRALRQRRFDPDAAAKGPTPADQLKAAAIKAGVKQKTLGDLKAELDRLLERQDEIEGVKLEQAEAKLLAKGKAFPDPAGYSIAQYGKRAHEFPAHMDENGVITLIPKVELPGETIPRATGWAVITETALKSYPEDLLESVARFSRSEAKLKKIRFVPFNEVSRQPRPKDVPVEKRPSPVLQALQARKAQEMPASVRRREIQDLVARAENIRELMEFRKAGLDYNEIADRLYEESGLDAPEIRLQIMREYGFIPAEDRQVMAELTKIENRLAELQGQAEFDFGGPELQAAISRRRPDMPGQGMLPLGATPEERRLEPPREREVIAGAKKEEVQEKEVKAAAPVETPGAARPEFPPKPAWRRDVPPIEPIGWQWEKFKYPFKGTWEAYRSRDEMGRIWLMEKHTTLPGRVRVAELLPNGEREYLPYEYDTYSDASMAAQLHARRGAEREMAALDVGEFKPVKQSTEQLGNMDEKMSQQVKDWLQDKDERPPEPKVLYRGTEVGTSPAIAGRDFLHASPWPWVAARGGKGVLGSPDAYTVYSIPVQEGQKYYRGGALRESPFETTRLMNAAGDTWGSLLDKAKALYVSRAERIRRRIEQDPDVADWPKKEVERAVAGALDMEATRTANDFRVATFETDAYNRPGRWAAGGLPTRANRPRPELVPGDVLEEAELFQNLGRPGREMPASPRRRKEPGQLRMPIMGFREPELPKGVERGMPKEEFLGQMPAEVGGAAPAGAPAGPEFRYNIVTPKRMEQAAADYIDRADVPSYDRFATEASVQFGPMTPGQVHDVLSDAIFHNLNAASGERLMELVDRMRLRKDVFGPQTAERMRALRIPDKDVQEIDILKVRAVATREAERLRRLADKIDRPIPKNYRESEVLEAARRRSLDELALLRGSRTKELEQRWGEKELARRQRLAREEAALPTEAQPTLFTGEARLVGEKQVLLDVIEEKARAIALRTKAAQLEEAARRSETVPEGYVEPVKGKRKGRIAVTTPGQLDLLIETEGLIVPERAVTQLKTPAQKLRGRAVSAIMRKMENELIAGKTKSLRRTDLNLEDIDFRGGQNAFMAIASRDLENLDVLGREITANASVNATTREVGGGGKLLIRRAGAPRTHTKRVTMLLDTKDNDVVGVATLRHPNRGPVLLDPLAPGESYKSMADLMPRFRPIYSVLLIDPVHGFKKWYRAKGGRTGLEIFNDQLADAANARAMEAGLSIPIPVRRGEVPIAGWWERLPSQMAIGAEGREALAAEFPELTMEERAIQIFGGGPTMVVRGEGGGFMGEKASLARFIAGVLGGATRMGVTLTEAEARSVFEAFMEVPDITAASTVLDAVVERARANTLTAKDWLLLNALRKIHNKAEWRKEEIPGEARLVRTLISAYEIAKQEERGPTAIAEAYRREPPLSLRPLAQAGAPSPTARELSMLRRVPPTVVRPEQVRDIPEVVARIEAGRRPAPRPAMAQLPPGIGKAITEQVLRTPRPQAGQLFRRMLRQATEEQQLLEMERRFPTKEPTAPAEALTMDPAFQASVEAAERKAAEDRAKLAATRTERLTGVAEAPTEMPASIRRQKGWATALASLVNDMTGWYGEWLVDKVGREGGAMAEQFSQDARKILSLKKELMGNLSTTSLDRAKIAAGRNNAATKWLHGIIKVTPGSAMSQMFIALEGAAPTGKIRQRVVPIAAGPFDVMVGKRKRTVNIPQSVIDLMQIIRQANYDIGRILEPVIKNFIAGGLAQRNLTSFGYDIIRSGKGEAWDAWVTGQAAASNVPRSVVAKVFRQWKAILDDPFSTATKTERMDRINQDFKRKFPNTITHLKVKGLYGRVPLGWREVVHADLFNYLEHAAQRATYVRAFRERFPDTAIGRAEFRDTMEAVKNEMNARGVADLQALVRTLQGHPTDDYSAWWFNASSPGTTLLRGFNQTVGNLMARSVLTGQMLVQFGETVTGAAPIFLGYRNYWRGMVQARQLYAQMERDGMVNRVMYDFSYDPTKPIRSRFRQAGNIISKYTGQQLMNEWQEAFGAATAQVLADKIRAGDLSAWERRTLPQTMKVMGFTEAEVRSMMRGDPDMLLQFRQRSAAFLSAGNKLLAENSRLGANRLFNSVFRFQMYPMMRMQQMQKLMTNFLENIEKKNYRDAMTSGNMLMRYVFGSTLQGALTWGLTTTFYAGPFATFVIAPNEIKEHPFTFAVEMLAASQGGALYLLLRQFKYGDWLNWTEKLARLMFPYAIASEILNASLGIGRYANRDTFERIGEFLKSKTPATRAFAIGMSAWAVSNPGHKTEAAIAAYYRWRKTKAIEQHITLLKDDDSKEFKRAIRKTIEANNEGDIDGAIEWWNKAFNLIEEPDPIGQMGRTFRGKRLLRGPENRKLTPELEEDLRKTIGDRAYERLEYYDMMLDFLARGDVIEPLP